MNQVSTTKQSRLGLLFLFLVLIALPAKAQLDTRHYIPPVVWSHAPTSNMSLMLSTLSFDQVSVTVRQGDGVLITVVTIDRDNPISIDLGGVTDPTTPGVIDGSSNITTGLIYTDKGLLIEATSPVFANLRKLSSNNMYSVTGKGDEGLGRRFRTGHYVESRNNSSDNPSHAFTVMATEDVTEIVIEADTNVIFENSNGGFTQVGNYQYDTVTLNAGEVFIWTTNAIDSANYQINGSLITSDKDIAVVTGTSAVWTLTGGCGEGGYDALVPIEQMGTDFFVTRSNGDVIEFAIVIADSAGTDVLVDGALVATLNEGETYRVSYNTATPGETRYIQTSKGAYVYQSSGGGCEYGLSLIPPVPCLGTREVVFDSFDANYRVMVVYRAGGTLTLNGVDITPAIPNLLAGNSEWASHTFTRGGNSGIFQLRSDSTIILGATPNAGGGGAFAYFSGFDDVFAVAGAARTFVEFETTFPGYVQFNIDGPYDSALIVQAPTNGILNITGSTTDSLLYEYTPDLAFIGADTAILRVCKEFNCAGEDKIECVDVQIIFDVNCTAGNVGNDDFILWLKADDGPNTSTDGATFDVWFDRGIESRHALQSTLAANPTYNTNIVNKFPAVRFDGTQTFKMRDLDGGDKTFFTVLNAFEYQSYLSWKAGTDSLNFHNASDVVANSGDANTLSTGLTNGTGWHIAELRVEHNTANGIQTFVDGTLIAQTTWTDSLDLLTGGFLGSDSAINFMDGYIAEMIAYDRALNATESKDIETYLALKYGMTLAIPYTVEGSNVYNHVGYEENIAGLGVDYSMCLDLLESGSINAGEPLRIESPGLNNENFLIWGDDGFPAAASTTVGTPGTYDERLRRTWRVESTGIPGAVTLKFYLPLLGSRLKDPNDYALFVDDDTDFTADATEYNGTISNDTLYFTGVTFTDDDYFTLAVPVLCAPGDVDTNIAIWLRADEGTGSSTDGDALTYWYDRREFGFHGIQLAANKPVYNANELNGFSTITFNGGTNYFSLLLDSLYGNDYTIFAVSERANNNTNQFILGSQSATANEGLELGYRDNTTATISQSDIDLDLTATGFDDAFEVPTILVAELNSGTNTRTITEYKIGTAITGSDANTSFLGGTAQGVIGRGTDANGFSGEIAEIIVYKGNLTASEIRDVNSYLALKYGLTIPVPYTASGASIYNNATYANNIAGVGFAFTQCFRLENSMTSNEEPIIRMQTPSDLGNGEYLVWGHNGASSRQSTTNSGTNDLPATYEEILDRVWYIEETGDVGTVTVKIPLTNLGGRPTTDPTQYALLISPDTDFETGVNIHTTGRAIVGDTLVFTLADFAAGQFFTLAVPELCAPGDVSVNWAIWLKANEGASTNVDGAPVSDWFDRSVFGTHATQSGANKPTYLADFSNGYPAITFNGGTNYFDVDLANIKDGEYTIFSVAQRTAGGADHHLLGTTSAVANQGLEFGYESNIGLRLGHISNQADVTVAGYNAPSIQPVLLVGSLETGVGKTVSEYKNGIKTTATNADVSQLTGTAAGVLGRGNGTDGFNGQIAEMIVYNGVITPAQVRDVESYLAVKYGMTIPLPYTAGGSNIYNFASYANDITGIGEDDDQCFYQPASSSISSSAVTRMESPSDMDNDEYLIWGHNGITASQSSTFGVGGYDEVLDRIWQVDKTGDVGTITVKFCLPALGSRNTTDANEYALLIDTDTDFTAGATFHTTGRSIVGDTLTFTLANFPDNAFFTLAVPISSCAPGDAFSNLYRWFKANEGTSTSVDGAAVAGWNDISTGLLRARQPTAGLEPIYTSTWKNNNPALFFNGTNQYLETLIPDINNTSYTIFTAVERIDNGTNYIVGNNGSGTAGGHLHFGYRNNTQTTFAQYSDDLTQNVDPYNIPEQTASIVSGWLDTNQGKNIKEVKSGNETFRSNTNTGVLNSAEVGEIGRVLGNSYFHGYIGEVIIFTDTVPAIVRRDIETYLAIKYGITMNVATQGYTVDGATIYNNISYDNNIAGIAINSSQCLEQTNSMSINSDAAVRVENASNLDDGEYFIWGHNGVDANNSTIVGAPAGYDEIMQRIWNAGILGDVGTTTMKFYLPGLGARPRIESEYALMIDTDTDFSTGATVHTIGRSIVGDTLIFTNVNIGDGNFFTLAVPEICAPGDVANNLNTWFKADEGTSSITNGADVAIWYDRTRNGNHATAGVNQPTFSDSRFNGYPALGFDGGTDYYNFSLTGIKGSSYTLFAVGERNNGNNDNYFLGTDSLTNNEGLFLGYGTNTSVTLDHTGNGVAATVNAYSATAETPVLLLGEFNIGTGKTLIEYKEGVATTATDGDFTPLTGNASGVLGRGNGMTGLNGDMSEVIVYTGVLNASDRRDVESYLAVKYSITLPIPYTAAGVNIYNNTGYETDIIGIGQDLTQCFDQPSTSGPSISSISTIESPSNLDDAEYLIFGHNGIASSLATTTGAFAGYDEIMERIWQVDETGDVGTVTLKFDLTKMSVRPRVATEYALLIDTDTDFTDATEHIVGRSIVGDTLIFTNVDFADLNYFTIAVPEEDCAPGDVQSGLHIWLKGDAGLTGTTDGDANGTWSDQSGNGLDGIQATGAEQPVYVNQWKNGMSALSFDGGDDNFDIDLTGINNTGYSIFSVVERLDGRNNNYHVGNDASGVTSGLLHFGYRNDTQITLAQFGDDITTNVNAHSNPEVNATIVSGWLDLAQGKNIKEIKNGLETLVSNTDTDVLNSPGQGTIGRAFGNREFYGNIGEVIIFTNDLTLAQRRDVETYLALKYGITMDVATTGYTADGTTLYQYTSYDNDIAGITYNRSQCLDLRFSMSINSQSALGMSPESTMGNGEYMIWGNNGVNASASTTTGVPAGYDEILQRIWQADRTGYTGTTEIKVYLPDLGGRPKIASDYALLINSTTDFSGVTPHITGASIVGDTLTFTAADIPDGFFFTLAVPEICAPGDVSSNLNLWLKADEGTSSNTDGAGLTTWFDRTRNGKHATQTGGNNPTFNATSVNGYPSVTFDGGTNYFDLDLDDLKGSEYTLFTVSQRSNNNDSSFVLGLQSTTTNEGLGFGYKDDNTASLGHANNDADVAVNAYNSPIEMPSLLVGELGTGTGKTIYEYKNSALVSSTNADDTFLGGAGAGVLGRGYTTKGFEGEISEVIAYTGILSATDKRDVETYLAIKYGMTLPVPYTAGGADIYNYASYANNIAGLGFDLTQCFYHDSSQSVNANSVVGMNTPSSLDDGDYLIWGHDGTSASSSSTTDVPPGYTERLDRVWQVDKTGDAGTVTVSFYLPPLGTRQITVANVALLIDTDLTFADATVHTTGVAINGDYLTFTVANFTDGDFFTLALPELICGPGDVATDMLIWLKADVGTSTTTNGATVETWVDQSLNGTSITQATAGDRPDYMTNWRNGNPAIDFNGNAEHFDFPELGDLNGSNYTIFGVVERTSNKGDNYFLGSNTSGGSGRDLHFGYRNNTQTTLAHWGDDVTDNVLAHDSPEITPTIVSGWLGSGSKTVKEIKSGAELEATDGSSNTMTILDGEIGRMGGTRNFVGQMGELIVYTEALTATQRRDVESYLAIKYGITMDISTLSYTADGTNLYTHANYIHDIAGLASNNSQCFVQDTAVSANGDAIISFHNPSDLGDGEYMIFGNNDSTTSWQSAGSPFPYTRMGREWRVQETGDVGTISISIDISSMGVVGTPLASDFAILFDGDTDLSDGSSSAGVTIVGNVVTFNNVDLSNGDRFTIGYSAPIREHVGAASTPYDEAENATGVSCVTNVAANSGWNIFTDAAGSVMFAIEPSGNNLGCINWGVRTLEDPVMRRRTNGGDPDTYLMNRNLWIEVENQPDPTDPVTVRMFVLTDEIAGLLADVQVDGYAATATFADFLADSLRMEKFDSTVVNVEPADNVGLGGTIVVYDPGELVYRNAGHGYYLEVSITEFSEFIPYYRPQDPIVPLPVELLYFRGKPVGEEVELTWSTATELNNDYFVVERSADGKGFYPIFEVDGAGTTKLRTNYLEYDTEPLSGKSYYRLKQVDFDGTFAYSRIVEIDMTLSRSIDLFPNPTKANFSLRFNGYEPDSDVKVVITTATGKLVDTRFGRFNNNRLLHFKASDLELPSGVYVLEIEVGNHKEVKRLVVK